MELIDKDAIIELIKENIHEIISESGRDLNEHTNRTLRRIAKTIEEMQTFAERKNGKWKVYDVVLDDVKKYCCPFCEEKVGVFATNYCPHCGAKMEGAEENAS